MESCIRAGNVLLTMMTTRGEDHLIISAVVLTDCINAGNRIGIDVQSAEGFQGQIARLKWVGCGIQVPKSLFTTKVEFAINRDGGF